MATVDEKSDKQLVLERPSEFADIKIGSSICVSGACLSVIHLDDTTMTFDVVSETWAKTKLGDLKEGDLVNLERALLADGRFEGHVVQGHIEGSVEVVSTSIPRPLPPEEEGENEKIGRKKITPKNILFFSRDMRRLPTKAEKVLWKQLRYDRLGVRFRRQFPIGGCILDFYCPSIMLGIEVDGEIHDKDDQKILDQERQQYLEKEQRLKIVRFTNHEVITDINNVITRIKQSIKSSPPPLEEGVGVEVKTISGESGEGAFITIRLPENLRKFVVPKGSIAIDGVSLTVAKVDGDQCSIALIPHTLDQTTLGNVKIGDKVNIETDILIRALKS